MAYLDDHPPASPQMRCPRRKDTKVPVHPVANITGCLVVHDTEQWADLVPPDMGTLAVAGFISRRPDPGSYHTVFDADSRLQLVRYSCEAFGDRTGSNRWGIHLSGCFRFEQWDDLTAKQRTAFVEQGALAALDAARWVQSVSGIVVPARHITKAQSDRGLPGFIRHAERDPSRRHDPPSECFLRIVERYGVLTKPTPPKPTPPKPTPEPPEDPDMPVPQPFRFYRVKGLDAVWCVPLDHSSKHEVTDPPALRGYQESLAAEMLAAGYPPGTWSSTVLEVDPGSTVAKMLDSIPVVAAGG